MNNPFLTLSLDGRQTGAVTAECRLHTLQRFTVEQCRQALALPDLQKTVVTALERRIRKLEKEANT